MSLINEALKKAQGQQQGQRGILPPGPPPSPVEPHRPHGPGKNHRRSFIWGFLMAVLIVGIFTTVLTTFFVHQFLGDENPQNPPESGEESIAVEEMVPAEPVAGQPERIPIEEPATTSTAPEEEAATSRLADTTGNRAAESTVQETPVQAAAEAETTPAEPPQPPNPVVVARMLELEIRGTLGGSKVLILDQATGRTRAYRVGDTLEGSMGLVVEQIRSSSVTFRDYAGFIHTKSF